MRAFQMAILLLLTVIGGRTVRGDDVIIRGGVIYDGSGGPPFVGDILIRGDTIVAVGDVGDAKATFEIDAEGLDYQVLLGLEKTIERHHPTLLIEYTPEEMTGALEFLGDHGYRMFTYDHRLDRFSPFVVEGAGERWRESALQVNLFCVTEELSTQLPVSSST